MLQIYSIEEETTNQSKHVENTILFYTEQIFKNKDDNDMYIALIHL